jgi:hypothetical protein
VALLGIDLHTWRAITLNASPPATGIDSAVPTVRKEETRFLQLALLVVDIFHVEHMPVATAGHRVLVTIKAPAAHRYRCVIKV